MNGRRSLSGAVRPSWVRSQLVSIGRSPRAAASPAWYSGLDQGFPAPPEPTLDSLALTWFGTD